jgi:GR25 family glycosyltransferase involved in LPS biosynthesis
MEDDTIVNSHFKYNIKRGLKELTKFDPDWEIMWVSGGDPGEREIVTHWDMYDIYRMDPPEYIGQGTVGYIMSPKGLSYFLKVIDEVGCAYASDAFLFAHLHTMHSYGINPPLLGSGLFKSTI